ncbi:MAG: pseudouridylate synthase [Deltaproteobacteria bacterium]|nr:pseudouridylate synthase [Deltaproteobacteria bacterium]
MLPIVFRDEHLVAIHKPAGLLVHRSRLDAHERSFALQQLRQQLGRRVYPAHRLDKATSGVLLFGLTPEVGAALSALFARQAVEKTYVAVVRGYPAEEGVVEHALSLTDAADDATAVQAAVTRFRRLATIELEVAVDRYPTSRYALVQLQPMSGRRHQLRRHMQHLSHPIIGDTTHGKGNHNRLFRERFGSERLLLACVELRLLHPITGEALTCTAPLAADFAELIDCLGWTSKLPQRWLARHS